LNKEGRPLEDLKSLPENWYNDVLELYSQGASDVEVKALIYHWRGSFSNDLWERWMNDEPEFSETIKKGKMLSESWWHKEGRTSLRDKDFSYTGWYMQMKNRFNWTDRTDNTTGGNPLPSTTTTVVFKKYDNE
jgi:hypothetical protein